MKSEEIASCCYYCNGPLPPDLSWHTCTFQALRIVIDPKKPAFGLRPALDPCYSVVGGSRTGNLDRKGATNASHS